MESGQVGTLRLEELHVFLVWPNLVKDFPSRILDLFLISVPLWLKMVVHLLQEQIVSPDFRLFQPAQDHHTIPKHLRYPSST